jgi:hypothetical protein
MLTWVTGRIDDSLRQKLEFVLEEDQVYRALLERHSPYWRLHDIERKGLAEKGRPLGKLLAQAITMVQPEALLNWNLGDISDLPSQRGLPLAMRWSFCQRHVRVSLQQAPTLWQIDSVVYG